MEKYKSGDVVYGRVTGVVDYGFFVALDDDYVGLVHISEMSEKFVKNVADYVTDGDNVYCKVLSVEDGKKVKLSIKNLDYRTGKERLEDSNGFGILRKKLPEWIKEYKMNKEEM